MQFDMVGTIRMQESSEVKKLELEMVKSVKKRKMRNEFFVYFKSFIVDLVMMTK